jgi:hypothetical protein
MRHGIFIILAIFAIIVTETNGFNMLFNHISVSNVRSSAKKVTPSILRRRDVKLYDTMRNNDDDTEDMAGINSMAKIKEEIASPFRKLRQFIYVGSAVAGGLGTVTAIPQLIFALQDGGDGVVTQLTNVGVDIGAIIGSIILWDRDAKDEKAKLERFTKREIRQTSGLSAEAIVEREKEVSLLPIEIIFSENDVNSTKIVSFADLNSKGNQNVIIIAGKEAYIKDAIISARIEGNDLFNSRDTMILPLVLDSNVQLDSNSKKGFGAVNRESFMDAPYLAKPVQINIWERYLNKEIELAEKQGAENVLKQGIVIAVNKKGNIVRRGLGIPIWKSLIDEMIKNSNRG